MKNILPLLFLSGIVILSGCTSGGTTSSSNGIIISSFIADPAIVEGTETVYFVAGIQNVGGVKATGIKGELIGLPSGWNLRQTTFNDCSGLLPPEIASGAEGETCDFEWEGTAPSSDTTIIYPVDFKVSYNYATKYEALLKVASRDWIKSLPTDEQESEKSELGVSYSGTQIGPIHVSVKLRTAEIYAGSTAYVILDIQNVGSGRPTNDIININVNGVSCSGAGQVKLSQGKSKQIRCTMPTANIKNWQNVRIDVDLNYDYWVKTSTEVEVLAAPVM